MKKMRTKWLPLLLIMALLSSLAIGCGTSAETGSNPPVEQNDPALVPTITIEEVANDYFAQMPADVNIVDWQVVKDRIDANDEKILLVDLRAPEDYAQAHIKGAVNVPFAAVHEYLDKLPVDKELIIYCYSGQTAGQALAIIKMYGYDVKSVKLGFDQGWVKKANFPTVTEVAELPADVTPAQPDAKIAEILKNYFAQKPENNRIIPAANVQKAIEEAQDVQIVDLRRPEDFAQGHVKGAINIPFAKIHEHFADFATDKPVYVYCYSGQTAGQAIAVLNVMGIKAVSVKGGFDLGWTPESLPVEK